MTEVSPSDSESRQGPRHEEASTPARLNALLGQYVSVWIWSILVGLTASTAFSFSGVYVRNNPVGAVLAFPVVLGLAAAFVSLTSLLQYLRRHIIPTFLHSDTDNERHPIPDDPSAPPNAHLLYKAFRYLIYAIMLRLAAAAAGLIIDSLGRF